MGTGLSRGTLGSIHCCLEQGTIQCLNNMNTEPQIGYKVHIYYTKTTLQSFDYLL